MSVSVCVCVCVSTPRQQITCGMIWTSYDWLNNIIPVAFQYQIMALAVNIKDRRDLFNEMRCQLPLKTGILAVTIAAKSAVYYLSVSQYNAWAWP